MEFCNSTEWRLFCQDTYDLTEGLVAHYEFEDNANDSSGNENHGTEHGGVSYADGVIGKAGSFDGIDDYIKVENIAITNQSTSQTVSVWFKINSNQTVEWGGRIIGISSPTKSRFYLQIANNKLSYSYGVDEYKNENINIVSMNKWNLATFVSKGDTDIKYIYLNGVQVSSFNGGINNNAILGNYNIGGLDGYLNQSIFKGQIDDFRIYNRALNETEIQRLYQMKN
jgi:hypothetical protein